MKTTTFFGETIGDRATIAPIKYRKPVQLPQWSTVDDRHAWERAFRDYRDGMTACKQIPLYNWTRAEVMALAPAVTSQLEIGDYFRAKPAPTRIPGPGVLSVTDRAIGIGLLCYIAIAMVVVTIGVVCAFLVARA